MNPLMKITGILATIALAAIIPYYIVTEPIRQEEIRLDLQARAITEATDLYAQNCVVCHGAAGEGIGSFPALDSDGLRTMPAEEILKVIERGRDNTQMAAWSLEEGGVLTGAQAEYLVTLIQTGSWGAVELRVADLGLTPPLPEKMEITEEMLVSISSLEGGEELIAGLNIYAENCAACHAANGAGTVIAPALNTDELRAKPLEELTNTVTNGVPATLMASWENTLTTGEINAAINFILRWPEVESSGVEFPEIALPTFPSSPEAIAAGDQLFHIACKACHGVSAYGSPMAPSLNNPTFLSETPDAAIYQIIAGGVPETLMPAWGARLTQAEMETLVAYLRSLEQSSTPILQP